MANLPLHHDFTGKVVVITGAGGVLCGDMARAYAQAGAKVAALDLNEEAVKKLSDDIWHDVLCFDGEPVISMGMSESFEEAIECGATMVRVGRQCFAKD